MGAPNVREGESVDIDMDSGAEVYPLHETRLSMVAANCMSSVPGSWCWELQTCEAML